jgi:tetraacyldisaccharide 4'-kinase
VFDRAGATWSGVAPRGWGGLLDRWVVRRLAAPPGAFVVAVGGSTLGGSGKTPLAIACAAELARAGARCVLVGHAYRAAPRRARFVQPGDRLDEVGDEALVAARALEPLGARVVVAPSRGEAMALSAREADVLVLDGIAQLSPARATLALLSVDAAEPWGRSRALPPFGVLRAPVANLVAACDAIVPMALADDHPGLERSDGLGRPMWPSGVESRGAWDDRGVLLTWEAIRSLRVGLLVALGRPERLVRALARRGVFPRAIVRGRDHGPLALRDAARRSQAHGIDVWLATPKCALHADPALPGLAVAVLEHSVLLNPLLRNRLRAIGRAAALTGKEGTNSLELLESTSQSRSMAADWVPSTQPLAASGVKMSMRRHRT